ncbi:MAG: KamA family radical SAM protein [Candidatus Altiarchaeales archaeon A3]|nr:MAG: KamA family radical SAM protein [Candidatus Altiarchaeales archaeon A3]
METKEMNDYVEKIKSNIWEENHNIYQILLAEDVEKCRKNLLSRAIDAELAMKESDMPLILRSVCIHGFDVMKNLLSKRHEKMLGFSTLDLMRKSANFDESIGDGFYVEIYHLFLAMQGKPKIYPSFFMEEKEYKFSEENPGVDRSNFLDVMYGNIEKFLNKYPSGLDFEAINKRRKNKEKILNFFGAGDDDWNDYRWHLRHLFKSMDDIENLKKLMALTNEETNAMEIAIKNKIPFCITPYYLHLMDFDNADRKYDHQIRAQVIPTIHYVENMLRHTKDREYKKDFMKERDTTPQKGITRRYVMISIIKPIQTCPQICMYCQRNWQIMNPEEEDVFLTKDELEKAIDWFSEHKSMREVLITGGDPFMLEDDAIEHIIKRFSEIEHIIGIRIGSRIPVTLPQRITKKFAEMLGSYVKIGKKYVAISTHIEHPYEITPETGEAIRKIMKQGITAYNQQVYTKETARRFESVKLRMELKKVGIDPYYTFYPQGKYETKNFLLPVARIMQERKEEARLLPGAFRTDEFVFNVPKLGKNHLRAYQDNEIIGIKENGARVYLFYPWEKNIVMVEPYIYVDQPIIEFLDDMVRREERYEDYESIWYYY